MLVRRRSIFKVGGFRSRRAFTLIEMLTTVAVLVIALGLMVSLARYVRDRSAQQLTRDLLLRLNTLMQKYVEHNGGKLPVVEPLIGPDSTVTPPASLIARAAILNNVQMMKSLSADYRAHLSDPASDIDPFVQQPATVYDVKGQTLRDAWGSPIVFMPGQHPLIGLAPSRAGQDQFFFFSAGPDRNYLTREDNLYSYETLPSE